jgi:hypothetical protein
MLRVQVDILFSFLLSPNLLLLFLSIQRGGRKLIREVFMVSLGKDAAAAFALLKAKKPGEEIKVRDTHGNVLDSVLIRRGRQNARVKIKDTGELMLIPLVDIVIEPVKS